MKLAPRPHELPAELLEMAQNLSRYSQAGKRRLAQQSAHEITRLRGQRKTLADLLEKASVVLVEAKRDEDEPEARGQLGDLICWCEKALKEIDAEMLREASARDRPTHGGE